MKRTDFSMVQKYNYGSLFYSSGINHWLCRSSSTSNHRRRRFWFGILGGLKGTGKQIFQEKMIECTRTHLFFLFFDFVGIKSNNRKKAEDYTPKKKCCVEGVKKNWCRTLWIIHGKERVIWNTTVVRIDEILTLLEAWKSKRWEELCDIAMCFAQLDGLSVAILYVARILVVGWGWLLWKRIRRGAKKEEEEEMGERCQKIWKEGWCIHVPVDQPSLAPFTHHPFVLTERTWHDMTL